MTGRTVFPRSTWWLVCVPLVLFAWRVAQRFHAASVWDDAYMFVRYADAVRATGVASFYFGGPGTYGLTSIGFLAVVIPIRALFPGNPALTALVSSAVAGVAFLVLLGFLVHASAAGALRRGGMLLGWTAVALAPSTESLAKHFTSGMDTTFALSYLALFIVAAMRLERATSARRLWWVGLLGGLAPAVRPDLALFTLAVPLAMVTFGADAAARSAGMRLLAIMLAIAALQLALFARILHSPVPLAFYAKSTGRYGEDIRHLYRGVPAWELLRFALVHALLLGALGWAVLRNPRAWWRGGSPLEKGLLAASLGFIAYYACGVLQIMHYAQRFYYPALPALVFVAVRACSRAAPLLPERVSRPRLAAAAASLILVAALARPAWLVATDPNRFPSSRRFDVFAEYAANWPTYWCALDSVSRLGDDLVIATTEVGHPLAMNPRKRVVDLAGLNETSLMLGRTDPASLVRQLHPDLVYMPHPDYASIRRSIDGSPWFAGHYDFWPPERLGCDVGVAVLRGGPHAAELTALLASRSRSR